MKFSPETIDSVKQMMSLKEIANQKKYVFESGFRENETNNSATKRLEENLIWKSDIAMPVYSSDESIVNCRVRKEDDVEFFASVKTPELDESQ
jgi:hypothetical protein